MVAARDWVALGIAFPAMFFGLGSAVGANSPPEPRAGSVERSTPGAIPPAPRGFWRTARAPRPAEALSADDAARLEAIGYASGYLPASHRQGVLEYDSDRSFDGVNFYTSGHAPEAILMDMRGGTLHRWRFDYRNAWPHDDPTKRIGNVDYWRRARLSENGDVFAIFEGHGLIKVDRNSNLLWRFPGGAHHDLDIADDGRIYLLTRREHLVPRIHATQPILEEAVTILSAQGQVLRRVSLLEALEKSSYASLLESARPIPRGDLFHVNTIEVLDGRFEKRSPFFREGNVLVSLRNIHAIAIVDMDEEKVVWALTGDWRRQHEPVFLDNGRLLLFDNEGGDGSSNVIEFDPLTLETVWSYEGDSQNGFYSSKLGSSQRLPNGNTLITESFSGRAFEVTPQKRVVWEFLSPHRAGEHDELVAVLCELVRRPRSFTAKWLRP